MLEGSAALIDRDRPILYVENDVPERSRILLEHIRDLDYNIWFHVVRLFIEDNVAANKANIFSNVASCNMLCAPQEGPFMLEDLPPLEDLDFHPFAQPSTP